MKLYRLSDDVSENGYVYSSGYGPIDDMGFLPPIILEIMKKSWSIDPKKPGMVVEPGRKRVWPDFLHNGSSGPGFFISERVICSLKKMGVEFYRLTEMPIGIIQGKWHQKNMPPKYYVAEIDFGGIEEDYVASGYDEFNADGTPTRGARLRRPAFTKNVYKLNTWNGKDLFSYSCPNAVIGASTMLFCTEKVKELGEKSDWVNVEFDQLELI